MKKIFLLLILIAVGLYLHFSGLISWFSLTNIQQNKELINNFTQSNYLRFILLLFAGYIFVAVFQLPLANILTLLGGALLGPFWGGFWTNLASTFGGLCAFLISRYLLYDYVQKKMLKKIKNFNQEIKRKGFYYLLFLHFTPVIPHQTINYLAGISKISWKIYIAATILGNIMYCFVYSFLGSLLWQINTINDLNSTRIFIGFHLFLLIVILPLVVYKIRK